jgi:2,3-dimethylmalate lyase
VSGIGRPFYPRPRTARRLRELLAGHELLLAPGAADALTARMIEETGYPICYFTGAGFANTQFAFPDVGLVTLTEMVDQIRRVTAACQVPVIADADTGYGNPLNVIRTVREFERAGAAGLQLEDQVTPKRCGHFDGKAVVQTTEMVRKIEAAVAAREDPDFVIVARTDAIAVEGFDAAIARARAYAAAGADVLFV